MSCLFCDIITGTSPSHTIMETDAVVAILDIHPISDGHTLILPKKHVTDLYALDAETTVNVIESAKVLANVLMEAFDYDGVSLMQSNGAFQDVPHFHLHVFGRKKDNDIVVTYPEGINEEHDHLEHISQKMSTFLS